MLKNGGSEPQKKHKPDTNEKVQEEITIIYLKWLKFRYFKRTPSGAMIPNFSSLS